MVARSSGRPDTQGNRPVGIDTQGLGRVGAQDQRGAFSTHVNVKDPSLKGTPVVQENVVLKALFGVGTQLVDGWIDAERQEAYLKGAGARIAGQAEEEMETNIFTRSWQVAGHRDTNGTLALANYEAELLADMQKLREMSPEDAGKYIAAKREGLQPTIAGMSRDGRSKSFTQLMGIDQTVMKKQATEHQKFIIEQKTKALTVSAGVAMDAVTATQGDPSAHTAAQERLMLWLADNVYTNPGLPVDVKEQMVVDILSQSMRDGNLSLYNLGRQLKVGKTAGGQDITMFNALTFENQMKLSKAYESGKNLNQAQTSQSWWANLLDMDTSVQAGDAYSYGTYADHVDQGIQAGFISPTAGHSMKMKYSKEMMEAEQSANLVSAYESGNYDDMARSGMTYKKIADSVESMWVTANPDLTAKDIAVRHLEIATRTGNPAAHKRAGELIQPSIGSLMTSKSEEINPTQAQIIAQVTALVDESERKGFTMARSNVLSSLDAPQQAFMSAVMEGIRVQGLDPTDAIMAARENVRRAEAMTPAHKREHLRVQDKVNSEILQKAGDPNTFWNSLIRTPAALFGIGESARYSDVRPDSAGSDSSVTAQRQYQVQLALGEELNALDNTGITLSGADKEKAALAGVVKRLIPTEGSALIVPRGTDMVGMFGLEPSYDREAIGRALGKAAFRDGLTPVYQMQEGMIRVDYYNDRGDFTAVATEVLDPKGVGEVARQQRRDGDVRADAAYGQGTTVKGPNGAAVTYNGDNSARVPNVVAKSVRDSLVKFEGVRNQAYPDGKGGKTSVGVGINSGNPDVYGKIEFADGVASNASISTSFMEASNRAMTMAVNTLESVDLYDPNNEPLISLMTNLIYQRPAGIREHGEPLLRAIRDGNGADAVKAVQEFHAFKAAPRSRRQFYVDAAYAAANRM